MAPRKSRNFQKHHLIFPSSEGKFRFFSLQAPRKLLGVICHTCLPIWANSTQTTNLPLRVPTDSIHRRKLNSQWQSVFPLVWFIDFFFQPTPITLGRQLTHRTISVSSKSSTKNVRHTHRPLQTHTNTHTLYVRTRTKIDITWSQFDCERIDWVNIYLVRWFPLILKMNHSQMKFGMYSKTLALENDARWWENYIGRSAERNWQAKCLSSIC